MQKVLISYLKRVNWAFVGKGFVFSNAGFEHEQDVKRVQCVAAVDVARIANTLHDLFFKTSFFIISACMHVLTFWEGGREGSLRRKSGRVSGQQKNTTLCMLVKMLKSWLSTRKFSYDCNVST